MVKQLDLSLSMPLLASHELRHSFTSLRRHSRLGRIEWLVVSVVRITLIRAFDPCSYHAGLVHLASLLLLAGALEIAVPPLFILARRWGLTLPVLILAVLFIASAVL